MTKFAYFEGAIRPIEEAKISVMNQTLNYGTGCFGGLRGCWNEDQGLLYIFRIVDHYRRFLDSAKLLLAKLPYTPEQLAAITVEVMQAEGWTQNVYIRPLAYKADSSTSVRLHNLHDEVTIFSHPSGPYQYNDHGMSVCTSSWRRVDDMAIPARGKLTGAYMNSSLIKSEAALAGFDDAIVLNQDGHVAEGSAANFCMVRNGTLITPPATENILEGITRRSIMQLAREELGLPVVERAIDRSELYLADEAFFCGTGAQITPIAMVDHRDIGDGAVGPVTRQVRDLYFRILYGREPKYQHWVTAIHTQPVLA